MEGRLHLVYLCLIFFVTQSGFGLECYKCTSEDSTPCTSSSTSPGIAIPAANCSDPNKLIKDWINNHDFMKYSIGDVNLEKMVNVASDEVSEGAELKEVTACAYFLASSENAVTAEVSKGVSKVRSFFGDEKSDAPTAVQEWVMRDCVTLKIQTKNVTEVDRCYPFPGKDVAKLRFCTCTTDKCNLPVEAMERTMKETEDKNGGYSSNRKSGLCLQLFGLFMMMVVGLVLQ